VSKREGVISGSKDLVGPLMEKYEAATWWFMQDEDVRLTPDVATRLVMEHGDMRNGFGKVRLPANQIVTLRAFGLVLGILGQLNATNNWFRIGRETIFGDDPVTELGQIEAGGTAVG
jgi:hypothetical protein